MRLIRTILCAALAALSVSCAQKHRGEDPFEVSLEVLTPTVKDGETFRFAVYSNRDYVNVMSFELPCCEKLYEYGDRLEMQNGRHLADGVASVTETGRYKLVMTVEDPETRLTKKLSGVYTGYTRTSASLNILNEVISTDELRGGYPVVIDGGSFSFEVSCKAEELRLLSFDCEFNDGQLVEDKVYRPDSRGLLSFTFDNVRIPEMRYSKPSTLRLEFLNEESGEKVEVSGKYVCITDFSVSGSFDADCYYDGDVATLLVMSNRSMLKVESVYVPSDVYFRNLEEGREYSVSALSGLSFVTNALSLNHDFDSYVRIVFFDEDFSQKRVTLDFPFYGRKAVAPSVVKVDKKEYAIHPSEREVINVWTTDEHTTGKFTAKVLNGSALVYAPENDDITLDEVNASSFTKNATVTHGRLFILGGTEAGESVIRVSSYGNESVYVDVKGAVRKKAAIVIDGVFEQPITLFKEGPRTLGVRVVTWRDSDESILVSAFDDESLIAKSMDFVTLPASFGTISCGLRVSYGARANVKVLQEGVRPCPDYFPDPKISNYLPESTVTTSYYNFVSSMEQSVPEIARALYNGNCVIVDNDWVDEKYMSVCKQLKSVSLDVVSLTYDRTMFDIMYVIYLYRSRLINYDQGYYIHPSSNGTKADPGAGSFGYWWQSLDPHKAIEKINL